MHREEGKECSRKIRTRVDATERGLVSDDGAPGVSAALH
jgi:hypothetical protein